MVEHELRKRCLSSSRKQARKKPLVTSDTSSKRKNSRRSTPADQTKSSTSPNSTTFQRIRLRRALSSRTRTRSPSSRLSVPSSVGTTSTHRFRNLRIASSTGKHSTSISSLYRRSPPSRSPPSFLMSFRRRKLLGSRRRSIAVSPCTKPAPSTITFFPFAKRSRSARRTPSDATSIEVRPRNTLLRRVRTRSATSGRPARSSYMSSK